MRSGGYGIHSTQIGKWKKQVQEAISAYFSQKNKREKIDREAELSRLYEEIGRLQTDLSWLKKSELIDWTEA